MLSLLLAALSASASPITLQHSARVLDAAGDPINGTHELTVSLHTASSGGDMLWSGSFDTQVEHGYASLLLDTDDSGTALDSAWFDSAVWVQLSVDGLALPSRQPLVSVPRAARAELAARVPAGTELPETCVDGELRVDTAHHDLRYCSGGIWRTANQVRIELGATARTWADGTVATSCETYRRPADPVNYAYDGDTGSGIYRIDPDGDGAGTPFDAWCEMSIDGGGWTLLGSIYGGDADRWSTQTGLWGDTSVLGDVSDPFVDYKSRAWNELDVSDAQVLWMRHFDNELKGAARMSNSCLHGRERFVDLFTSVSYSLRCGTGNIDVVLPASDGAGVANEYEEGAAYGIGGSGTNGFCWFGGDNNSNTLRGHAGWNQSGYSCVDNGHLG